MAWSCGSIYLCIDAYRKSPKKPGIYTSAYILRFVFMVPKIDLSMVFSSYMFFSSGLGYIEIYHHCGGLRHSFHPQLEQELSKTDACTRPSYCQERSKQTGPLRALV